MREVLYIIGHNLGHLQEIIEKNILIVIYRCASSQLQETGLQIFPYPTEQSRIQSSTSVKPDEHSSTVASFPVGVTVALPDSILFLEDPHVARWDPFGEQITPHMCSISYSLLYSYVSILTHICYCTLFSAGQHWRADCISEASYDAETRSISFKMDTFYAFTLLQESYANMPFQSWELRPLGQDSALFTITGALIEVCITVKAREALSKNTHEYLFIFNIHIYLRFICDPGRQKRS